MSGYFFGETSLIRGPSPEIRRKTGQSLIEFKKPFLTFGLHANHNGKYTERLYRTALLIERYESSLISVKSVKL